MNLCLCGFVNSVCSPSARIRKEGLEPISIKHVSLTIRIFNIAGRFETCPYDHGNVAQNGRHNLGRGFNPCFVDDARDGNPEGVKQNGDIIMEMSPHRGF